MKHRNWTQLYCRQSMQVVPNENISSRVLCSLSMSLFTSSRPVLRNFAKFIGKHLCQSLIFNKVAGLRPATLLKGRLWHRCFPMNFVKFLRTPFLQNNSGGCFYFLKWPSFFYFERSLSKSVVKNSLMLVDIFNKTIW